MPNSITRIVFDMGGVVLQSNKPTALQELARKSNQSLDSIAERFRDSETNQMIDGWELGEISDDEALQFLSQHLCVELDAICTAVQDSFVSQRAVIPVIASLAMKFQLVLASNSPHLVAVHVRSQFPVFEHFGTFVFSYQARSRKPDSEFFEYLIGQVGSTAPDACLFIDDNKANVDAARQQGFNGVLFQDVSSFRQDLKELLELG